MESIIQAAEKAIKNESSSLQPLREALQNFDAELFLELQRCQMDDGHEDVVMNNGRNDTRDQDHNIIENNNNNSECTVGATLHGR